MFVVKTATGLYLRWDSEVMEWFYEEKIENANIFSTIDIAKAVRQGDERIFSVLLKEGFVQNGV